MNRYPLLARLAVSDLWHDRKVSLCIMASLIAVIAPLLLLFGLKFGVISQLQQSLLRDPANLEVKMLSSGNFDAAWIARLQQRPDVGFAIGVTRSLNTQADLFRNRSAFVENAEVIPTDAGDPLVPPGALPLNGTQVILSAEAARRLDAKVGETVRLRVARRLDGVQERGELTLDVVDILPPARYARPAVFVALPLLVDLERFRDGRLVPRLGLETGLPDEGKAAAFARARVYASDIDGVEPLALWLAGQRIETASQLQQINNVRAINRVLTLIFGVIAGAALLGCVAALLGAFLANIDRKRRDLAVLRLLGFTSAGIGAYVALQVLALSVAAYAIGLLLYLAGSTIFNQLLSSSGATGDFVCVITPVHAALAFAICLAVAIAASAVGLRRAIAIQPADSLREI
ncbi:ABC transporter permease [Achromobacter deleyi]|uniref:ABC transporter permease n=1 Tax=Achromobacter deleyi TaxID=1353891 RepID=UPI001492D4CF|nr:ABC transporter permease [Achromobacter deleyi]QVQ24454.1 ABC transporter permease [Achromobacter deleyi]UIP19987.1 ABC transporter permease [Achromobacter deleyi]